MAWLDWLRFLAAFMVVLGHTRFQHFDYYQKLEISQDSPITKALFMVPRFANESVMIFFVLSGFLVGGRCIERVMKGCFEARGYIIDRVTRIGIPLVPTVFFTWFVEWTRTGNVSWIEGIGNLASLQGIFVSHMKNNGSLWSLSYEVWFYVLALGAALVVGARKPAARIAGLVLSTVSLSVFVPLEAAYLFVWVIGALAYFSERNRGNKGMLLGGVVMALLGLGLAALGVEFTSVNLGPIEHLIPPRSISVLILALGISLALPTLIAMQPVAGFAVRFENLGTKLALSSYSLYLIHRPVLELVTHFEGGRKETAVNATSISIFAGKMFLCLVAGWIFYLLFEKHTAKGRKWLVAALDRRETGRRIAPGSTGVRAVQGEEST